MAAIEELQRRAERGLHARVHDVDRVDLVEHEMDDVADEEEAAGQPGDAGMAVQHIGEDHGGRYGAEQSCKYGVPDTAVHGQVVKDGMEAVPDHEQGAEPQNP